jgi:hypothetical protein
LTKTNDNLRQNPILNKEKNEKPDKNRRKDHQPRAKNTDNTDVSNSNSLDKNNVNESNIIVHNKEDENSKSILNDQPTNERNKRRKRKPIRKDEKSSNDLKPTNNKIDSNLTKVIDVREKPLELIASPTITPSSLQANEIKPTSSENQKSNLIATSKNRNEKSKQSLKKLELDIESSGLKWIQTKQQKNETNIAVTSTQKLGRKIVRKTSGEKSDPLEMVETKKTAL